MTTGGRAIEGEANSPAEQDRALRFVCRAPVLRRNLTIALIVGSILSLVNQTDVILSGNRSWMVLLKILFNFLVPFTVASVSSVVNRIATAK